MTIPDENGWISVEDIFPDLEEVLIILELTLKDVKKYNNFKPMQIITIAKKIGPQWSFKYGTDILGDYDFFQPTHWRPIDFPKPSWEKE